MHMTVHIPPSCAASCGAGTISLMRRDMGSVLNEKERLETQVEKLLAERDMIRMKVEAMLDAVAALDPEMAEEYR